MALGGVLTHGARTGVTLTEVVISSALLVVALVPALRALTIAQMTGTQIEQKTQSLILAQGKLDEIRARSVHHYDTSFHERSKVLARSYLCDVTDDEDPDLRLVTVSVGHDDDANGRLSNRETRITLATYVARRR
jgi:Tfp pilus assembly protein PilV